MKKIKWKSELIIFSIIILKCCKVKTPQSDGTVDDGIIPESTTGEEYTIEGSEGKLYLNKSIKECNQNNSNSFEKSLFVNLDKVNQKYIDALKGAVNAVPGAIIEKFKTFGGSIQIDDNLADRCKDAFLQFISVV